MIFPRLVLVCTLQGTLIPTVNALLSVPYLRDLMTETTSRSLDKFPNSKLFRCELGYTGSDCSQLKCPYSMSFATSNIEQDVLYSPSATSSEITMWPSDGQITHGHQRQSQKDTTFDNQHVYSECGGRGLCDRSTGECKCFPSFTGEGCRRSTCPNDCSGHGQCRSDSNSFYHIGKTPKTPYGTQIPSYSKSPGSATWGNHWTWLKFQQCHCDAGYEGDDCSLRMCPKGDDPETDCVTERGIDTQKLTCEFENVNVKKAFFQLRFADQFGAEYDTRPIKIDADLLSESENSNSVQDALESLPNFAIPQVEVDVDLNNKVKPIIEVFFTHAHNTGPQKLLQFIPKATCESGSQPLFRVVNTNSDKGDIKCTVSRVNVGTTTTTITTTTPTTTTTTTPTTTTTTTTITTKAKVATQSWSSYVIKEDGTLWAAGHNNFGQLGDGTGKDQHKFVHVLSGAVHISTSSPLGANFVVVVKQDGSLWATGANSDGQHGDGTKTQKVLSFVKVIASGVKTAAAGGEHTLVIKDDGSLWAAGGNSFGQFGDGTKTSSLVFKKLSTFSSDCKDVSAGKYISMRLQKDGSLWGSGWSNNGQLGDGSKSQTSFWKKVVSADVAAVSASYENTALLKNDGSVWITGKHRQGQIGDGEKATVVMRNFKKVVSSGVMAVSSGYPYTMIIKSDKSLWATGSNDAGQFGDGTKTDSSVFKKVYDDVKAVYADNKITIILKQDGSVWTSGDNVMGGLGDGTTVDKIKFTKVMDTKNRRSTTTTTTTLSTSSTTTTTSVVPSGNTYKESVTCSNRGICDQSTGLCNCFDGYFGLACDHVNTYM